ncbi:MAG: SCO family protein [Caldilineales bacterium]
MFRVSGWLAASMLAVALLAGCGQPYTFQGTAYPEPLARPAVQLTSETGQPFDLSDQSGKVSLLFFGYTTCPDVCPTTLAEARTILNDLGDDAQDVEFLFVTVDPERDTPEKLSAYTDAFHPGIVGLTGTPEQLAAVYDEFGVRAERVDAPDSALGYLMNHTSRMYLVDRDGNLRLSYGYGTPLENIVDDVRHLVK